MVTSEFGINGGGLALTSNQLLNILKELGCKIEIEMSLNHDGYFAIDGGYDPELGKKIRYSIHLKNAVEKYSHEYLPDILISYGAGLNGYFTFLLSKKLQKPYYVVLCGSDVNIAFASVALSFYNKLTLTHAKKVIALSQELLENARIFDDSFNNCKYCLIPNTYEFSEKISLKNFKFHTGNKIIFTSGSTFLSEKKGIANLIKAFSIYLKNTGRDDVLKLYGKIDDDILLQYNKLIAQNHVDNNIKICGYLDRETFNKELEQTDIYLQLSPFEGCCNSIGEAILNGKHILISDTGYFAEKLKEKFPQLILDSLCPEDIADFITNYIKFIENNDIRQEVINYLKPFISSETVVTQWKDILNCCEKKDDFSKIDEVVMFHDIAYAFSGIDYPKFAFEKLVRLTADKGYRFCSYSNYTRAVDKKNLIICTFDDAYDNVYKNALPIMKEYGFTATVFVCPDLIGKSNDWNHRDEVVRFHMDKIMLQQLKKEGWEIGSHGIGHYNLLRLSQTELENCIRGSKMMLTDDFGEIKSFCYPYGEHKKYIREMVSKFYDVAFSVDVGESNWKRNRYQITRIVPEELKKILENIS
ncbi:MAG: polysaccharide deacetylase family protein [Methanobrevibacter sp.]|nr:polysaccharide deacetylase family protein [Methanobrevibacter sp.]